MLTAVTRARFIDVARKGMSHSAFMLRRPSLVPHALRGLHIGEFQKLDVRWLTRTDFRSILDVGANAGQFSGAARLHWRNANIWAFEPLPDAFAGLESRLGRDRRVSLHNVAIGDVDGEAPFHRSSFGKASSLREMATVHKEAFPWTANSTLVHVPIRRLDTLLDMADVTRPSLMKVDVQGTEDQVIRGAERILDTVDWLMIEMSVIALYAGQPTFDEVYGLLRERGFEFRGSLEQLHHPADDRVLQIEAVFRKLD